MPTSRRAISGDPEAAALTERLLRLAVTGLPRMYRPDTDEFAFTRARTDHGLELRGTSLRYAAIVALGAHWLEDAEQKTALSGHDVAGFIGLLAGRVDAATNLGDVALVTWAAAQSEHPQLGHCLRRLRELDTLTSPEYVVEAAWVVSALAAARGQADVEAHLAAARDRLLDSVRPGSPVFPHETKPGLVKSYRSHVACFADQVYPIQALARLHRSGDDPAALAAAQACAAQICAVQGDAGQWWWHYDARTGNVVEGYPVYTVHQHAMAPMALLDLAEAGGTAYPEAIRRGLMWIVGPDELGDDQEPMVYDEDGVTWRKVYRGDPRKVVRGVHTLTTGPVPGLKVPGLDRIYRPKAIDRECRPYEFGWLLFTWLGSVDTTGAKGGTA